MRFQITRQLFFCATAIGLALGSHAAFAKNWVVTVGGSTTSGGDPTYGGGYASPVLMFEPSNLTINVGDTVIFNGLGGAPHNVHADDNSFRCAHGCDNSGGDGDPASDDWSSSITFNNAGVIHYHCDIHQSMGMTGTITVNDVAPPPGKPITSATSGLWYDPLQSGHGFMVEILPNNVFLAVWFTFTPQSTGASQQNWLYVQGNYTAGSNTVTVAPVAGNARSGVLLNQGGAFPPNFVSSSITTTQWGTMTFTFNDCNSASVNWNSLLPAYPTGSMNLQRLTGVAGLTCQ